jgi:FkbM family methyltransferase
MLDIGAYTGDTLKSFIAYSNGDFKKYIAVEPDTKNFQKLELLVGTLTYSEKIETIQECCSEEPGYLRFNDGQGGSSTISDNDGVTVKAETIDHIASCCGDRITMIKMDIEGSEMRALRGAKHTIASDRPALAICVYHRKSDLITIPQYIKGLAPDYKFYFRLHSPNITEAVLYVAR